MNNDKIGLSAAANAWEDNSLAVSASFNGSRFVDSNAVRNGEGFNGGARAVDDSDEFEEDESENCYCGSFPFASFETWLVATSVDSSTLCLFFGNSMSSI